MNLKHHFLAITPLAPVHMGTDADYEPTGYVIDDGALFEFDGIAALQSLPPAERRKLDQILSGRPDDRMLREVQAFFYANRQAMMAHSHRLVRINPTIEAFYKDRVGKVAQHEHGGRKVQNKLEIERTAWNPVSGQPILPGSGLKGAIRTALLNEKNSSRPLLGQERNRDLQNRLFDFRPGKFELDPMRLIRLGDAPLRDGAELPTEVLFALNRKKRPVEKNGTQVASQAEQRGLYQLLECLPPLHPRAFAGSLSVQELGNFGNEKNTPRLRFSVADIATACNRFYRPIFDRELALLRQRGFVDGRWAGQIEQLLANLQPYLEANRAFLLRVGRHSGAESVTLEGVRRIKIMKGRGEKPDWSDSPKTLWLAGHERQAQRGLLPFGWLLVEIDPTDEGPWKQIESPTEGLDWLRQVRKRIEALVSAAAKARAEQEQQRRRREQEEAARKEAQEAERRRLEEEARRKQAEFDALPASEKRLRRFQAEVDMIATAGPLNKDQFGRFKGLVSALIDEAGDWSADERARAAEVIEAAFERLGWTPTGLKPDKRKKQEKKNRDLLTRLRG